MENTKETRLKSDKMGTMPVGKLLFSMSLPAMISMLVQALYNIVDSIFVSQYSDAAFTAVNLSYPMVMLVIAFGIGIGVGANAQIAKRLGEGDQARANCLARQALFMAGCVYVGMVILSFTCSGLFLRMFTQDEEIIRLGTLYLNIYMGLSIFAFIEMVCSKILQATGNMKVPMMSQLIGAITNIILDPILINGINIGGTQIIPEMGVAGAAIATVIGQAFAMTFVLTVFLTRKQDVSLSLKGFRPNAQAIGEICRIGLPAMVMNAIGSVTTATLNGIIAKYMYAVDTLGIYFKTQSFIFMPVFGLTQGALPILSYNFGANNKKRYKQTVKLSLATAASIMLVGFLLFQFATPVILLMFNTSADMAPVTIHALKTISWCFLPASCGIMIITILQSLGKGLHSLSMSIARQLALLIPVAIVMDMIIGLDGVWLAYPVAEVVCVLIFVWVTLSAYRKAFRQRAEIFGESEK